MFPPVQARSAIDPARAIARISTAAFTTVYDLLPKRDHITDVVELVDSTLAGGRRLRPVAR